jgi:predicted lipase
MSSIAYESTASIDAWSCARCKTYPMKNVKSFSNSVGDLQGFTGFSTTLNAIVVSFRGSSNIQNWIINLSTNQVDYPKCSGCKVHNGFYTAWNNLAKPIVTTHIQNLRSLFRDAAIYVTGHSLGGAIAALSVPDIKQTFGSVAALITFGEPRVGNQAFASYYTSVIAA